MPGPPRPVTPGSRSHTARSTDRRAVAPVVGVVLLVGLVAVLGAAVGITALGTAGDLPDGRGSGSGPAALSLSVDAGADRLTLVHRAGPPLDVRQLVVRVRVAGTPLEHQRVVVEVTVDDRRVATLSARA
ncbi:hypothetical protein BRC62_02515 [Halobacteriales archaeon QH_10_67_13]|nr:MAG: hypothetical protein BRC62_02515 [Halobacteriales archaeon QH_10_67_13]